MRLRILFAVAALAATASAGCAQPDYTYAPIGSATATNAELEGAPAANYPVPTESPHGDVKLAMLGVQSLRQQGADDSSLRAIHIAVAVANRSDDTWSVDPSEQRATLTARRERADVYATSPQVGPAQKVEVPAHSSRVIDLYFPLPVQLQNASELPSFDVTWTVHTGARVIAQRTPFQRFIVPTAPPLASPGPPDVTIPTHEVERMLPGSEPPDRRPLVPEPFP